MLAQALASSTGYYQRASYYHSFGDEARLETIVSRALVCHTKTCVPQAVYGAGTGFTYQDALLPCLGELTERLAAHVLTPHEMTRGSFIELGEAAVNPTLFPTCTRNEYDRLGSTLVPPSTTAQLQWVRGISLHDGSHRLLPAQTVFLTSSLDDEARFSLPISTGCAAHTTLLEAILGGLLEVVERDALATTWLLNLRPRAIAVDTLRSPMNGVWKALQQCSRTLRYTFLNATSDVGVPVVIGVRTSPDENMRTLVACSASYNVDHAIGKVVKDLNAHAIGFRRSRPIPIHLEDFDKLHHGAVYMAHADREPAFAALLTNASQVQSIADLRQSSAAPETASQQLRLLLCRLKELMLDAFVVDLSTRSSLSLGVRVVRVIVPGLQPLPYMYKARYLAHTRLTHVRKSRGALLQNEEAVNRWPLPFA